jgi:hypothetical protein
MPLNAPGFNAALSRIPAGICRDGIIGEASCKRARF